MTTRSALPTTNAIERTTAYEEGIWFDYKLYESNMPGIDGDYWYSQKMVTEPLIPGDQNGHVSSSIVINNHLPGANSLDAGSTFTLTGSARSRTAHHLLVYMGAVHEPVAWENTDFYEAWQHTVSTAAFAKQLDLILTPGSASSDIRVDKVHWKLPVQLTFGGLGGFFTSHEEHWRYKLTDTPDGHVLYDVTDPIAPVILQVPSGRDFSFEDGFNARRYLLSGPGVNHIPEVSRHSPPIFDDVVGADALYIAPLEFHDELTPLVHHRRSQGYVVSVVDVQNIYDAWSYGDVDPKAIRSFLQYAVFTWPRAPISAVLVGDSTTDPHDYLGEGNVNVLPAYLAHVDKFLGETACENCFAQLDGEDPLNNSIDAHFLNDIWIGRFSAQNEEQLTTIVSKILHYEQDPKLDMDASWRQSSLYIADNFIHKNGVLDEAGDFAYLSDIVFKGDPTRDIEPSQSANMQVNRVYFDPNPAGVSEPWREPDPLAARLRTIEAMQRGPGLVSYNGHSNHFQWATTDRTVDTPYMFGLNDILTMDNYDQLSIVLGMTCYTSQFTYVSATGTTMDERFQRHEDGGAVAVWGSAGLTVAFGHDALMRGFQEQLWRSPRFGARLGELTQAGYLHLFGYETCCQSSRKVYVLLGDPLTPALVWGESSLYLPLVSP